jgi:predicted HTH domain antitoxin
MTASVPRNDKKNILVASTAGNGQPSFATKPGTLTGKVRLAAAMKLHELGHLSAGAAADLAGIPKVEFLHKLADFGVEAFRTTAEQFDLDQDTLRRSLG